MGNAESFTGLRVRTMVWTAFAVYAMLLACQLFPFSSSSERVAPYLQPFSVTFALQGLAAAAIAYYALAWRGWRTHNGPAALCAWVLAAIVFHAALSFSSVFPVSEIVLSSGANGFRAPAALGPGQLLQRAAELPVLFPAEQHVHTNMLGKPLLYSLLSLISGSPLFLGLATIALSKLAAVALYFLAAAISEDRRKALLAAVLYLFAPSMIYFSPLLNTVTPLLLLSAMIPVVLYFRHGRPAYAVLCGVLFYCLLMFEPAPGAVFCLFALLTEAYYSRLSPGGASRRNVLFAVLFAAAFAGSYLLLRFAWGYDLAANLKQSYAFATGATFYKREYWRWFALNPVLFIVNCGLGAAVCAAAMGSVAPRRLLSGRPYFMEAAAALTLLLSLLFLDTLGIAGAEAPRLWLYLVPFVQLLAAAYCVEKEDFLLAWSVLAISMLQASLTLPVAGFVIP